jgi:hypothetical protein
LPLLQQETHPIFFSFCCCGLLLASVDLVAPVIKQVLGRDLRLRLNLQGGSLLEVQRALQAYGLTTDHVDAVFGGAVYQEGQGAMWLKKCFEEEEKAERHLIYQQEGY